MWNNNINDVIISITEYAEAFSLKSVWEILSEMTTDCYMNVRNWLTFNNNSIKNNEKAKELDLFVNSNWNWENDSIKWQSEEVHEALVKLYNIINNA